MANTEHLTERQREVYEFIRDKIRSRGYGPTVREIGLQFNISSPNGVMCHLKALEKKGLITREPNMSRAIMLATESVDGSGGGLPLRGQIAAGALTEAVEQNELVDFGEMFNVDNAYVLKVKGDSMIDDGIFDGDLIAVHWTNVAENGQIVVARIDGEVTVKRFQRDSRRITLLPRNPDYAPIVVAPDADFAIEGLYCGLVRGA